MSIGAEVREKYSIPFHFSSEEAQRISAGLNSKHDLMGTIREHVSVGSTPILPGEVWNRLKEEHLDKPLVDLVPESEVREFVEEQKAGEPDEKMRALALQVLRHLHKSGRLTGVDLGKLKEKGIGL